MGVQVAVMVVLSSKIGPGGCLQSLAFCLEPCTIQSGPQRLTRAAQHYSTPRTPSWHTAWHSTACQHAACAQSCRLTCSSAHLLSQRSRSRRSRSRSRSLSRCLGVDRERDRARVPWRCRDLQPPRTPTASTRQQKQVIEVHRTRPFCLRGGVWWCGCMQQCGAALVHLLLHLLLHLCWSGAITKQYDPSSIQGTTTLLQWRRNAALACTAATGLWCGDPVTNEWPCWLFSSKLERTGTSLGHVSSSRLQLWGRYLEGLAYTLS